MSPQEIEKLLGGYATDTLTEEERRTLFEAALGNQALFDALADEQALRELLQDPGARARLLGILREPKPSPMAGIVAWLRRPSVLALASAVAAGIVVIAVVGPQRQKMVTPPQVAELRDQKAQPAPQPEPKPAAQPGEPAARKSKPAKREETEYDTARRPQPAAAVPQQQQAQADALQTAPAKEAEKKQEELAAAAPPAARMLPAPAPPPAVTVTSAAPALPAPVANARDLYYAFQPGLNSFVDEPKAAKAKRQDGGRVMGGAMSRMSAPRTGARLPGIQYRILKRAADGSFQETDPAAAFARGDVLRLRFEVNQPGNLAVMEQQRDGTWSLRMAVPVRAGEPVFMPDKGTIEVGQPGEMHFFVRLSRMPQAAGRLYQVTPTPGLVQNTVSNATYVVNQAPAADPAVEFEITIVAK